MMDSTDGLRTRQVAKLSGSGSGNLSSCVEAGHRVLLANKVPQYVSFDEHVNLIGQTRYQTKLERILDRQASKIILDGQTS